MMKLLREPLVWVFTGMLLLAGGASLAGTGSITVKDSTGTTRTYDVVTDGSGNFVSTMVICDQSAAATCATVTSTNGLRMTTDLSTIGTTDRVTALTVASPTANFTRPNDSTAYAIGDMVANNTSSGSVTPMSWTINRVSAQGVYIRRVRLNKSTTGVTAPNFRLHLFTTSPTPGAGDNAAYASTSVGWVCDMDVNMYTTDPFSDGSWGAGVPNNGSECAVVPSAQTVYGLLEARGAYAPGAQEVFTALLEVYEP